MLRVTEQLGDTERLVFPIDELQRLAADPEAFAAVNALLHEHQSPIRLCSTD
jgi:hypothetical protein